MSVKRFLLSAVMGGWMSLSAFGQTSPPTKLPDASSSISLPHVASDTPVTATNILTSPPGQPVHPAGTVTSPFAPHGCNGPYGGNGPVTYELYFNTGPSLVIGGSELSARLNTGWRSTVGGRTLLFNTTGDAAWALDLGISYTYNRGRQERGGPIDVHTPAPPLNVGGQQVAQPDGLRNHLVRGLHRTEFNFAIGRDWWLRDVGFVTPMERNGWNRRVGTDLGGRWGTSHVDLVPERIDNPNQDYLRKRSTTHSIFWGVRADAERQVGSWIFFTGARSELDYTWTNVVPPKGGDIVSINFLFHVGVRY